MERVEPHPIVVYFLAIAIFIAGIRAGGGALLLSWLASACVLYGYIGWWLHTWDERDSARRDRDG